MTTYNSSYYPSPNEETAILKAEKQNRQRKRFLEVREQERQRAKEIRDARRIKRDECIDIINKQLQNEFEETKKEKNARIQEQIAKMLNEMGRAEKEADEFRRMEEKKHIEKQKIRQKTEENIICRLDLALKAEREKIEKNRKALEEQQLRKQQVAEMERERSKKLVEKHKEEMARFEAEAKEAANTQLADYKPSDFTATRFHYDPTTEDQVNAFEAAEQETQNTQQRVEDAEKFQEEQASKASKRYQIALVRKELSGGINGVGEVEKELAELERMEKEKRLLGIRRAVAEGSRRDMRLKRDEKAAEHAFEKMFSLKEETVPVLRESQIERARKNDQICHATAALPSAETKPELIEEHVHSPPLAPHEEVQRESERSYSEVAIQGSDSSSSSVPVQVGSPEAFRAQLDRLRQEEEVRLAQFDPGFMDAVDSDRIENTASEKSSEKEVHNLEKYGASDEFRNVFGSEPSTIGSAPHAVDVASDRLYSRSAGTQSDSTMESEGSIDAELVPRAKPATPESQPISAPAPASRAPVNEEILRKYDSDNGIRKFLMNTAPMEDTSIALNDQDIEQSLNSLSLSTGIDLRSAINKIKAQAGFDADPEEPGKHGSESSKSDGSQSNGEIGKKFEKFLQQKKKPVPKTKKAALDKNSARPPIVPKSTAITTTLRSGMKTAKSSAKKSSVKPVEQQSKSEIIHRRPQSFWSPLKPDKHSERVLVSEKEFRERTNATTSDFLKSFDVKHHTITREEQRKENHPPLQSSEIPKGLSKDQQYGESMPEMSQTVVLGSIDLAHSDFSQTPLASPSTPLQMPDGARMAVKVRQNGHTVERKASDEKLQDKSSLAFNIGSDSDVSLQEAFKRNLPDLVTKQRSQKVQKGAVPERPLRIPSQRDLQRQRANERKSRVNALQNRLDIERRAKQMVHR